MVIGGAVGGLLLGVLPYSHFVLFAFLSEQLICGIWIILFSWMNLKKKIMLEVTGSSQAPIDISNVKIILLMFFYGYVLFAHVDSCEYGHCIEKETTVI